MYFVVFIWLATNIKAVVGEKVMSFRKGLQAIEFKFDQSKLNLRVDSLGIMHVQGEITFRNYGSDSVTFQVILHKEDFFFLERNITDIILPEKVDAESDKNIKIPPKTTLSYPVDIESKLTGLKIPTTKTSGSISIIQKITIISENERKTFEFK